MGTLTRATCHLSGSLNAPRTALGAPKKASCQMPRLSTLVRKGTSGFCISGTTYDGIESINKRLLGWVCYAVACSPKTWHQGRRGAGPRRTWDRRVCDKIGIAHHSHGMGGSPSLPTTAVTGSPALLCSRSLHASRAAVQDHHRDHRGGAVGTLLLPLRRVGDQLHSEGKPTCRAAQGLSIACSHPHGGQGAKRALPCVSLHH